MKRVSKILTISTIWIILLLSGFYTVTATAFEYNPGTYIYFHKISKMPFIGDTNNETQEQFWQHGGNCASRAKAFKIYLQSRGVKNVRIVKVFRTNKKDNSILPLYQGHTEGHEFVVWNGRCYSPDSGSTTEYYGVDIKSYQKFLKTRFGFNTWCDENGNILSYF